MQEQLRFLPIERLGRRPPGAALSLRRLSRRRSTECLLVYYDAKPPNRIVSQKYHMPVITLQSLDKRGLVQFEQLVDWPRWYRYLRIVELRPGRYRFLVPTPGSLSGPPIEKALFVRPGQVGVYEIAASIDSWYPMFRPSRLNHVIYHGWR